MNLRQLQYVCAIVDRNLSVSSAAEALNMNQPGISKQVRLLEGEIGVEIFTRTGNRLRGVTPAGEKVISMARTIMNEVRNIRTVGRDLKQEDSGALVIATTHTQARYVLPAVMKRFTQRYPKIRITMRHADPARIVDMLQSGTADFGLTANDPPKSRDFAVLPSRTFEKVVIVPRDHKLAQKQRITLRDLIDYPLVTYEPAFTARTEVVRAFEKAGIEPKVIISAIDADVIKTCVEQGLGITVLSAVTYDARRDRNLHAIRAAHLFPPSTTKLLFSRHRYLTHYEYDFIEMFAPRWTRTRVQQLLTWGRK